MSEERYLCVHVVYVSQERERERFYQDVNYFIGGDGYPLIF